MNGFGYADHIELASALIQRCSPTSVNYRKCRRKQMMDEGEPEEKMEVAGEVGGGMHRRGDGGGVRRRWERITKNV